MSRLNFALALVALSGCDYDGAWLFPETSDQAPALYELKAEDGGPLVPHDVASPDDAQKHTVYAEVGAPVDASKGGVTFNFLGTGADVCVFVDPEAIYWTQAISPQLDSDSRPWSYPDNLFDDGDLDLSGGLSVYYTGSPDKIGDFKVQYEDSLGNPVEVSLSVCQNTSTLVGTPNAHSGRGTPEYCTISTTDPGVQYTIVMETWSAPLDDDRLAFGLLLANGDCDTMLQNLGAGDTIEAQECVIPGESIRPEAAGPWYGFDAVKDLVWSSAGGSYLDLEAEYCDPDGRVDKWCQDEADKVAEDAGACDFHGDDPTAEKCFCGDPTDTPDPGAI